MISFINAVQGSAAARGERGAEGVGAGVLVAVEVGVAAGRDGGGEGFLSDDDEEEEVEEEEEEEEGEEEREEEESRI